ncbi:YraN family protein [Pannonibacter tanglangensis]|uniref:YraN family protein n=1 Tax=Pannonibacter tanglangensis TaxID=2750084 RepID=UPI0032999F1B
MTSTPSALPPTRGQRRDQRRDRRRAYRLGLGAESLAALLLRLKGWRILARRFRSGAGEVDLIARRGEVLAFIEVKARGTRSAALEAVTATARGRIIRAARIFLVQNPDQADTVQRFDLVLVLPWRWPEHVVDAFQATHDL